MQGIHFKTLPLLLALLIGLGFSSGQAIANSEQDQHQAIAASQQLNVNQASEEQLTSLPGIGPARAAAIIERREEQGPFRNLDDLQKVSGIGPATIRDLQPLVNF